MNISGARKKRRQPPPAPRRPRGPWLWLASVAAGFAVLAVCFVLFGAPWWFDVLATISVACVLATYGSFFSRRPKLDDSRLHEDAWITRHPVVVDGMGEWLLDHRDEFDDDDWTRFLYNVAVLAGELRTEGAISSRSIDSVVDRVVDSIDGDPP